MCLISFHFISIYSIFTAYNSKFNELNIKILSKYLPSTPATPMWPFVDWNTSRCAGWHSRWGWERCEGRIGESGWVEEEEEEEDKEASEEEAALLISSFVGPTPGL